MFVFDRSAFAVVLPLALLVAVVLWSNRGTPVLERQAAGAEQESRDGQALAVNLPSR